MKITKQIIGSTLFSFLLCLPIYPDFDDSPWLVINNTASLDFACEIELNYYQKKNANDNDSTVFITKDSRLTMSFHKELDNHGKAYMRILMQCVCPAGQATVLHQMFYEDDIACNPDIQSITITHPSLQVTRFCYPTHKNHRYFSINYHNDEGLNMHTHTIPLYIRCLSNFKLSIRNIILGAMHATNWLPY